MGGTSSSVAQVKTIAATEPQNAQLEQVKQVENVEQQQQVVQMVTKADHLQQLGVESQEATKTANWKEAAELTTRRVVTRSAVFGGIGAVSGGVLSAFRDASASFYMGTMGMNYFLMSFTYFGILEAAQISFPDYKGKWQIHCGTGAVTGALFTSVFIGPRKVVPGILLFAGLGTGGFYAQDAFEAWRLKKRQEILLEDQQSRNMLSQSTNTKQ